MSDDKEVKDTTPAEGVAATADAATMPAAAAVPVESSTAVEAPAPAETSTAPPATESAPAEVSAPAAAKPASPAAERATPIDEVASTGSTAEAASAAPEDDITIAPATVPVAAAVAKTKAEEAEETSKNVGAIVPATKAAPEDDTNMIEPANVTEAEGQVKKLPYPKSVFFIISNEFCERFNYYGMRTVLVLYLNQQLGYEENSATVIFHIFTMLVYFLCIFGAIISDSWLGKFKTILYLSIVYVFGSVMLTLGAIPPLNLPADVFTMVGLSLVALGSGGIKPCVAAFGGDQFKLPEQVKQMTSFFSLFYFAINSGSLISTTVTPILREDVQCFGSKDCYPLAFGVPAILMIVSIVIFVLGRPLYKVKPPAGNMVLLVTKTISNAIATKWREKKTNPRDHWLDYADKKYDKQLINDVKVLLRVLVLYLPLPVFWALFDQQGSRWTFQATRMDGDMGSWDIKPDQVQVINPLLILIFIPLYDIAFYPALSLIGIRRPLQKLTLGGIFAGIAFIISAVLELNLEPTYPTLPAIENTQLRIFNGELCTYTFNTNIPNIPAFSVEPLGYYVNKDITARGGNFTFTINSITASDTSCPVFNTDLSRTFKQETAYSLFLNSKNATHPMYWYEDFVGKPSRGGPLVRTLANVAAGRTIKWQLDNSDKVEHEESAGERNLTELSTGNYDIYVGTTRVASTKLSTGGVYTYIIDETATVGVYQVQEVEVTEPNSVNILWVIPQYVVLTLGEVMFSVTGLEFSYSQAPMSMKSVLQACWLLTVAFGNVIDVIIVELSLFESQASEFFLFAGLMFVDMGIFMLLAYWYTPNNPVDVSETEPLMQDSNDSKQEILALSGIENKANTIDEAKE